MRIPIVLGVLKVLDGFMWLITPRYRLFLKFYEVVPSRALERVGYWRAIRASRQAVQRVPAYRAFLAGRGSGRTDADKLATPETDKENYVRAYPTSERCLDGRLTFIDTAIDESSGSSGTPHNWVRSNRERRRSQLFISHFARYCFGNEPWITINAFSMGAWATGINMGIALQRNSLVKNVGPDIDKILSTLAVFGSEYPYLICGYPPFLKQLIDEAERRGFALDGYELHGLVGGEGMSEGLRDYLRKRFRSVYSGYGATDLEIGMAGETPISVALRRAARDNEKVRSALFGLDSRLPMVFQYNPLSYRVIANEQDELVFTISRLELLSPRIAYNIHDKGGAASYDAIERRTLAAGISLSALVGPSDPKPIRLPFLWVYGRSDSTVSVMGANFYPEDVEQALYAEPELAAITRSYCLSLEEGVDSSVRACFSFEVLAPITADLQAAFDRRIVDRVRVINADFRAALAEQPETARPLIRLFGPASGPFQADDAKIKQTRLLAVRPAPSPATPRTA